MNEVTWVKVQLRGLSGDYSGIDYIVEKDEFLIGRHFDSDLILKENTISGKHAKLTRKENYYEIEDLGSTNGTSVNKKKITKQKLRTEDVISFDKLEFRFINPDEVGRTTISTDENSTGPDQTIVRAETFKGNGFSEKGSEAANFKEFVKKQKAAKSKKAKPGLLFGILLSLIMAFTINAGFPFLIGITRLPSFNLNNIWNSLKGFLSGLPFLHTHTYWTITINIDLIYILSGVCIPVGLILSGLVLQRSAGGSRFRNAIMFGFLYMIILFSIQFTILNFNLNSWLMINSTFMPAVTGKFFSVILLIVYIWAVSFIFSITGMLFSKNHK